ncbi:MAG TPA: hypothetical protein PLC40_11635, partial [Candidatus Hydrogenedentes bacterium]|nr:hypothetical protein [Candidatus Hydrogenedentota bacterium]
ASVHRVPWNVLYDASTTGSTVAKGDATVPAGSPALYTFTVEVKFRRTQERPVPVLPQDAAAGGTV